MRGAVALAALRGRALVDSASKDLGRSKRIRRYVSKAVGLNVSIEDTVIAAYLPSDLEFANAGVIGAIKGETVSLDAISEALDGADSLALTF